MNEESMRLFIALQPAPAFRDALAALQEQLRAAGVTGRYLTPENLHQTLAFIGMWPEDVTALLPPVDAPFPIVLSHVGVFPKARVLWAGVEPSGALDSLARQVRRVLAEAEIPFDRQEFNPHITLARKPNVPENMNLSEVQVPRVEMTVRDICLFHSDRGENGMAYTVIGRSGMRGQATDNRD